MTTKKFTEYVVIRDHGKQGLALFDMTTGTNRGNVMCWSTVSDYTYESKGFRPDLDAPMCFEEVPMSFYQKGMVVAPGTKAWKDFKVDAFIERYRQWAIQGYEHLSEGEGVELEIIVVQKDQERFRRARWTR